RYLVYSHNHFDHAYGGEVFDQPGVTLVSHELARRALKDTRARTPLPDIVFSDSLTIHMGGESMELRYHGANNGDGSVSFLFPHRRLLYVVDWIVVGRLPYQDFQGYDLDGCIRSTEEALALDWDTFVGGHADVGDRSGVERFLRYLTELREAVLAGMLEGKSLETLQKEIRMEEYQDLKMHKEWLPQNVKGVYQQLRDKHYLLNRPR
ncbi:MAG: MBL fold metallo-hydrolase, partial [Candidatus Eremiobacteraeota bacterium]|nr:MBL fold metallo-hydrolase [Candidatus Eremiobacteraeota bacterium]